MIHPNYSINFTSVNLLSYFRNVFIMIFCQPIIFLFSNLVHYTKVFPSSYMSIHVMHWDRGIWDAKATDGSCVPRALNGNE